MKKGFKAPIYISQLNRDGTNKSDLKAFIELINKESKNIEHKQCTWGNHHQYTHGY